MIGSPTVEILIISDDVSIHESVLNEIKPLGILVRVARGDHGFSIQSHKPDLILLDFRLAKTDSIALCIDLKDRAYTRDIPVIFMISADDIDKRRLVFNAGANDILIKPLLLEELLLRINSVFEASGRMEPILQIAREMTERKQAEQQMDLMSFTFDQLLDAVFLIDPQPDSCFSYVNDKACLSLGYSREELLNMRIVDIDPVVNLQDILNFYEQIDQQGFICIETYHRRKNGEIFPVELSSSRFIYHQKSVFICVVRDITERKSQQEKLRASEQGYRTLAENIPDPISRFSPDGRCLFVNQAMARLIGQSVNMLDYSSPEVPQWAKSEVEKLSAFIQQVVDTHELVENEALFMMPDGSELILGNRYIPEFGINGDLVSVLLISHDVTEQRRSEKERQYHLRDYECMERVNRAIQGSPDFESMMNDVLDVVLEIFDCDRAYLIYPCDPEADFWQVSIERTRPEYPGALRLGLTIPMDEEMATTFQRLLDAEGAVTFGSGNQYPLPEAVSVRFGFKAMMSMILYPKGESFWNFGIHQCSALRTWTSDEIKLFQKISQRLTDGLNSLLAYRSLQRSETLYRSLVAAMIDGIIVQSSTGEIISVNPSAEKILGLSTDKLLGKCLADFLPAMITRNGTPFAVDQLPSMVSLRTGQPQFNVEMGLCQADVETVWISINAQSLIEEASLQPYAVVSTLHNITERKRMEAIIRARETEFRALADNLPDIIIRYDVFCRRIYANKVYLNTQEAISDEGLGKTPLEFWRCIQPNATAYMQILQRVIATGNKESLFLETVDKKGQSVFLSMSLVPEHDPDGIVNGVLACATDITEIKKYEHQIDKKYEHQIEESHLQLRALTLRSEKMREEERKRIARELHDDLGQRLTALRLEVSCLTLRYGQNNPALEKQGQDIEKSIATTIQIIRNVVTSMRPTTLEMGIISALKWLAQEFRKNTGISCRLQLSRRKMQLNDAQAIALFRIAQESLTNIMRHAKASHVEIVLSTDGKNYVMVISDNGIGFDVKAKRKVGSFGIIGIEERALILGGQVSFDAAPSKGVKVTVSIPVASNID